MEKRLSELAEFVDGELQGDPELVIDSLAEIQKAKPGQLSFLGNLKYKKYVATTGATALIIKKDLQIDFPNLIKVDDPTLAFARLLSLFFPPAKHPGPIIHETAVISRIARVNGTVFVGAHAVIEDNVEIGKGSIIHPGVYIGKNCKLGEYVEIFPNVVIYHDCIIGSNVRIHAGTVVGSDGFGYVREGASIRKIPQVGKVIIEDDVEIGSNCTIDRATLGETIIGRGSKLDNLIQIAHNVKIGQYCFLAAQTGIAGSTILEDYVTCAGQVGIAGHLHVGKGAIIASQAGVTKDVPPGKILSGYPAKDHLQARKEEAHLRSLPELKNRVKSIEKILERLVSERDEKAKNHQ